MNGIKHLPFVLSLSKDLINDSLRKREDVLFVLLIVRKVSGDDAGILLCFTAGRLRPAIPGAIAYRPYQQCQPDMLGRQ
jgi:hypothetical protein